MNSLSYFIDVIFDKLLILSMFFEIDQVWLENDFAYLVCGFLFFYQIGYSHVEFGRHLATPKP